MMKEALLEAKKCEPKPGAFCVGCVLVSKLGKDSPPVVLARGFSRELEGNTHAEANALTKSWSLTKEELAELFPGVHDNQLNVSNILRHTDVYTTMEPCSIRTSGLAPCADALVEAGIARCIIGLSEPEDFVHCEGAQKLAGAGIDVIWLKGLEKECLDVARKVTPVERICE